MNLADWTSHIASQSPIPPRGNPYARIALVGEAPGERERLLAKPFVGEAGRLLTRLLASVGLREADVWLDNVCPFQPPRNEMEAVPPEALSTYSTELTARLDSLPNLTVLVPLGNTALQALTGKKGISKWRGSVLVGGRRKTIPTFHPAYLLRSPAAMGQVLSDFRKIQREAASSRLVLGPPKRQFLIYPTQQEARDFLILCRGSSLVSIDIEGNPKTREISCIGFAPSATCAMCLPLDTDWAKDLAKSFLASPTAKVGHNAALFDNFWLSWEGMPVANLTLDTMYLHHCLDPSEEHSLAALASLFTEEPYWKDEAIDPKEGTSIKIFNPSEAGYLYNCKDASVTYELAEILVGKVRAAGKWDFYQRHYASLFPALLSMMLGGIRVDREASEQKFQELSAELKAIEAQLEALAGEPLIAKTALSRQREARFLYETLALPKKWTKGKNLTSTRSLSTSEDTIKKLMEKFPKKLAAIGPLLLDHARKQKLSTFYNPRRLQGEEENSAGLRLHFTLKPSTGTGRLASSKSPFKTGSNAQNLDREARSIYLPEPGHLMLEIDGSQVESRMCYMLTGDPELVRLANTKPWEYDAHKENAARIFAKPLASITKAERYTAKIAVHSAQRAGTGATLQGTFLREQGLFKPVSECQGYIDSYFRAFPAVKDYFSSIQSQLFRERRLVNRWGREISFPWERFSDELFREAYSFPMQADCADWINTQGVIPLHNWLASGTRKSRLLLTVHDSLLISLDPGEAWDVLEFIIPSLEQPITYPAGPLVVPVEMSLGRNWGDKAYEWKQPPSLPELGAAINALFPEQSGQAA